VTDYECEAKAGVLLPPFATAVSSPSCVFDSHVAKFSEVLIERGHRDVFGCCSRGDCAVHEMNLRPSISAFEHRRNLMEQTKSTQVADSSHA
jgi:hypothetical protein